MKGNALFRKIDRFIGIPMVLFLGIFTKLLDFLTPVPPKTLSPGDRLLVVKLSALGDTLLLLPVLKALKEKIGSHGKICVIATSINQEALKNFPYVDQVEILDFNGFLRHPLIFLSFLRRVRDFRPIFSLDFDQWLRISPLLCFFSGASSRYGFKTPGQFRHYLYQQTVLNEKKRHEFEQFASIADLAGIRRTQIEEFNGFLKRENLYPSPPRSLNPSQLIVHIHPGCGASGWRRAWPENNYIELVKKIKTKGNIQIQMTGMGKHEEDLVRKIIQSSKQDINDYSGHLEMDQLSGLLRNADLVICGNTGIMHLAVGWGCSLIALHGPTNPTKWGPLSSTQPDGKTIRVLKAKIPCSPCLNLGFDYGCDARPCMESISVEETFKEVMDLLPKLKEK